MRILYLSCHEVLEYDELVILGDLGIEVFSAGAYLIPNQPSGMNLRPPISNARVNQDDLAAYRALAGAGVDHRRCLTAAFLDRFDTVIVMHKPEWVEACFDARPTTPIVWRTIGQSSTAIENRMSLLRHRGLKVIRYSPRERLLKGYCGHDAIIRFGKSLHGFEKWTGDIRRVVSYANWMLRRGLHCSYKEFRSIVGPFECDLYGIGNEDIPDIGRGPVTYEDQLRILNRYRTFVYTGTFPASYTLAFTEAWLAGIPVVAIGHKLWQEGHVDWPLYEVPDLITHGVDGFVSDSVPELQSAIRTLINDDERAAEISRRGRESAMRMFDASMIRVQWRDFLNAL